MSPRILHLSFHPGPFGGLALPQALPKPAENDQLQFAICPLRSGAVAVRQAASAPGWCYHYFIGHHGKVMQTQ